MAQKQLIGESTHFLSMLDQVSKVAKLNRPILILGERGSGKELIAQRLHYLSTRWDSPLITLNCAALSDNLVDSELFGHESGSFTGAKGRHSGRFERAEGGTLFLDEIATAPLAVQEKLLRVIEYGEYERVGGQQVLRANVRVICATNEDLIGMSERNEFRADLLDRLAFDVIHVPPLRERIDDILPLANFFGLKMAQELGWALFPGIDAQASHALLTHLWPGNVRELKNVVERAVYRHIDHETPIDEFDFNPLASPFSPPSQPDGKTQIAQQTKTSTLLDAKQLTFPIDLKSHCNEVEKQAIISSLNLSHFNQRKACELLNLSYHQLRGLMRKHAINVSELK